MNNSIFMCKTYPIFNSFSNVMFNNFQSLNTSLNNSIDSASRVFNLVQSFGRVLFLSQFVYNLLFFRPQFTGKYTVLYMNPLSIAARRTGGKRVEVPTGIRV